MDLPEICTAGTSWASVAAFVVLAWLSGVLMGFALRAIGFPGSADKLISRRSGRRRRTGYYFSEETRSWGRHDWRTHLAWTSAVAVLIGVTLSGAIATAEWKAHARVVRTTT